MSTDPFDTPEARVWAQRVLTELVPMIDGSAISVSIVPTDAGDIKFAVELGLSIMLDKPIILAVPAGRQIPEHLVRVADEIVDLDTTSPLAGIRIQDAINRVLDRLDRT